MPDFKKMTVESLRELARKTLGPGHSRLKTKSELIRALEQAGGGGAETARAAGTPARSAAGRAAAATGKAVRAVKQAGGEGARAVARAGKAAAEAAAQGARAGVRSAKERKTGTLGKAAAAAAGAVAGVAVAAKRARGAPPEGLPDPEGYFVARVRGQEAVREAPHAMAEEGADRAHPAWSEGVGQPLFEEALGELPWGYGDDAFVALPRDPKTVFLYWEHSRETLERSFGGMDHPRAQLWVFGRTSAGWDRVRTIEFALESRGYYVHDLEPGRLYRAEIHAVDRAGRDRLIGRGSNEVALPPVGPSPLIDDRFIRIPWDMPLGRLLGRGHPGDPFSEETRALLERLSDWTRFSGATWGSAGGMGGRPFSPTSSPSPPPGRPGSGEER
ncbi:MAG TPA: DUF4912 domain-containing protein [Anaeromyxobacter sp.]